jgi:hypothetical protein
LTLAIRVAHVEDKGIHTIPNQFDTFFHRLHSFQHEKRIAISI